MKHRLEWEDNPNVLIAGKSVKAFTAVSMLRNGRFLYCIVKQKSRWTDESDFELLGKHRSRESLADAKKALQNRENRLLNT